MTPILVIVDALDTFLVIVETLIILWLFVDGRIISKKTLEETIDLLLDRINKNNKDKDQ